MTETHDMAYMQHAFTLAARGLFTTHPNPRVGCVLVLQDHIVGEGWHQEAGGPHAEVVALQNAGEKARGATCYVTLEPCSHQGRTAPCTLALIDAGIKRVVVAVIDPNPWVKGRGIADLQAAGIEVTLLEVGNEQHTDLNAGFFKRMHTGRPFVRIKLAMSLDGRTAMASGESQWITGEQARQDVQYWRARSDAIVTGIGTVLADDPALSLRPEALPKVYRMCPIGKPPLRVIADTTLRIPIQAKMFTLPGQVLCVTSQVHHKAISALEAIGVRVSVLPQGEGGVDLAALLQLLAEHEINDVWVEAGARLAGRFLQMGLWDELIVYMAPKLMGDQAKGLVAIPGLTCLSDALALTIKSIEPVGADWRIRAVPKG